METGRKRKGQAIAMAKKLSKSSKSIVAEALAVAEKQPELITKGAVIKQHGTGKRKRFIIEVKELECTVESPTAENVLHPLGHSLGLPWRTWDVFEVFFMIEGYGEVRKRSGRPVGFV